jgi:hypothetical protein
MRATENVVVTRTPRAMRIQYVAWQSRVILNTWETRKPTDLMAGHSLRKTQHFKHFLLNVFPAIWKMCLPSTMFPLSCAGARPRGDWNSPTDTELLPRSWNFSISIVNILIMHITKKFLKCRAVVRSCKNFLLRAVGGPRSCKKKIKGRLVLHIF